MEEERPPADSKRRTLQRAREAEFIKEIIREVGTKLDRTVLSVDPHLIGRDYLVQIINSWLQDGSSDIGIGTICGMGGIGKTTIAKVASNQNFVKFEGSSFLANIRKASVQPKGLVDLQKQLLSDILKGTKIKIYNVDEGVIKIKKALCCKRVLLVLDDIDQLDQFHAIIGMGDWLYPGSKIIITTRHERLLKGHDTCQILFKVNELDEDKSLKLFSRHAFGQDYPVEAYLPHSRSIVQHCGGLPLALQVLGSSLSGNSVDVWESATQKLKAIPDSKIFDILKISFNSLKDDHDKDLFLDIACFFVGWYKNYITMILDEDLYAAVGIENLIERGLVTIDYCDRLQMHQLIQDMGREIIRQESPRDPGERRRLFNHKDAFNVLRRKTGTKTIEGLALNFREQNWEQQQSFECDAFARMHKLRLLSLNYVQLTGGYENFPKDIKWLCWHGFPLESIPHNFSMENLVVLEMRHSCLTHLWKGAKRLEKLKILDVSYSHHLIKTPDVSRLPMLERLMLKDCISLIDVHESIGCLDRLVCLNLKGCKNLGKLPQKLGNLTSLQEIDLSGCSKLELVQRPEVNHFSKACLPHSLTKLNLANSNLTAVPSDIGTTLIALWGLKLDGNPICSLPESIWDLTMLHTLSLNNCRCLQSLEVPSSVRVVDAKNCTSLEIIIPNWVKSPGFFLEGCSRLREFEGIIKLEPLDKKIWNSLRLFEIFGSNYVRMYNRLGGLGSDVYAIGMVLYEWGIASVFLSGSQVPNWYSYKREGRYISFKVPLLPNKKIQGMNVCVVYDYNTCDYYSDYEYYAQKSVYSKMGNYWANCGGFYSSEGILFHNFTQDCRWDYSPFFHGNNHEMIWLSHWKFKGDELKGGDEVIVTSRTDRQVKSKIGVHLVYEEDDEQLEELSESSMNFNISSRRSTKLTIF